MLRSYLSAVLGAAAIAVIAMVGMPLLAAGLVLLAIACNPDIRMPRFGWAMMVAACAVVTVLGGFGISAAFAQDVAASVPDTTINFSDTVMAVLGLVATALAAAVHTGVRAMVLYLKTKTGIDLESSMREYLDPAIDKAVAYGRLKAEQLLIDKKVDIDVHNETIAGATNYLLERVPDALAYFGLTEDKLRPMIEARIGAMLGIKPGVDYAGAAAELAKSAS